MRIKNKLGWPAHIAAAAVGIVRLGLSGVAMAGTAQAAAIPATCTFQTSTGNHLTAVDGGGRATDAIHTDATAVGSWEVFQIACTH